MKNKLTWIVYGSSLAALIMIVLANVYMKNNSTQHRADEKQQSIKVSPETEPSKKELNKVAR